MQVKLERGTFDVRFRYNDVKLVKVGGKSIWETIVEGDELSPNTLVGFRTTCEISRFHPEFEGKDRHETVAIASVCYNISKEAKPLSKSEGQKQAFGKALHMFTPLLGERVAFWQVFAKTLKAHRWMLPKLERSVTKPAMEVLQGVATAINALDKSVKFNWTE